MSRPESPGAGWGGDPRRGAALGRPSSPPTDRRPRLSVRRVRLNGDYDQGGTYWGGGGAPLYYYEETGDPGDNDPIDGYLRADDRDGAIAALLAKYPGCTFDRGMSRPR